jgi:Kef-type K+ transport system membrane component KefB
VDSDSIGRVILDILVVLLAAKVGGEIAERLGQPAVLGELAVGVLVGPSLLGWVEITAVLTALAQLGAILLLFEVGLETDLASVLRVGGPALRVATTGVVLPLALGYLVAKATGHTGLQSIFLGATLTATSVGITARILSDMRKLDTEEGRTILGAAVADDVIGLVILAVVSSLVVGNRISALSVGRIVAAAFGFLLVALVVGVRLSPPLFRWLSGALRVRGVLITAAFAFCLLLAYGADVLGLAPIVGAFAAGVVLARTDQHQQIRERLTPLADVFIPIFFLSLGTAIDVGALTKPGVIGLAAVLSVVGVVGKVASGWSAPRSMSRLAIGVGMIPRGEVGLIFASYGLARGVVGPDSYAALLLTIAVTTFVMPPLARPLFDRLRPVRGRVPGRLELPRAPIDGIKLGPRW